MPQNWVRSPMKRSLESMLRSKELLVPLNASRSKRNAGT